MPLPQEKTVCRRSTPLCCKEEKSIFPNSPLRTGLCIGAEARQKNALLADHAQKVCMFTVSSVRVWGPPPCCLCSKCKVAATSSSHSHAAVATKAEAKQQRKNNGNKSYSILKFFSGSCLRENKELLPKPTLVLLQGPNMTEITPVRNFTRAMLCFQSLSWKSCSSSVCLGILLLQCLCLAMKIQSRSCIPKVLPWDSSLSKLELQTFMHSCVFKWNFLLKPVFRLLRKCPCFALYHKIHSAGGTYLECCM